MLTYESDLEYNWVTEYAPAEGLSYTILFNFLSDGSVTSDSPVSENEQALALFTVSWWNFDYSGSGILLMLIFYLCRNRPGNERPQDVIVEPLALDHPFQPAHRASAALHQDDLSAGKLHAVGEGGLQPL